MCYIVSYETHQLLFPATDAGSPQKGLQTPRPTCKRDHPPRHRRLLEEDQPVNYASHYDRLIIRARSRVLDGYKERHHVLSRCMGGTDAPENIVNLTAEEHYVAHQLLVKMHPHVPALAQAANLMSVRCSGNKSFGWLRRRNAKASAETNKGQPVPPERRAKIGAASRGNKYNLGRKHSAETKAKWSAQRCGKSTGSRSSECREKIGRANSIALRGKPKSAEHLAKIFEARRAYFSRLSPDARRKMAPSFRGKTHSAESRTKMSASHRARLAAATTSSPPEPNADCAFQGGST